MLEAAEGTGDTPAMLIWFAFGIIFLVFPLETSDWRVFTYAFASLTLVRMLAVFVSVAGLG